MAGYTGFRWSGQLRMFNQFFWDGAAPFAAAPDDRSRQLAPNFTVSARLMAADSTGYPLSQKDH
ncbi:protein of unknown function [Candidatus Methylocalor cossyra]|uniref:Uncharacterized protein n=1 Tax=Candidatus Methylocalor cossyra TaxID=3108543 RepID=A0ABM9NMB7_9GAMM